MIEHFRMEQNAIYLPAVMLEGIHSPMVPGYYMKILRESDRTFMEMVSFFQAIFTEDIIMINRFIGIDTYAFLRNNLSTPQHSHDMHSGTDPKYIPLEFP